MLSAGAAALAAGKLPKPEDPPIKIELPDSEPALLFVIETNLGTLRFDADLFGFPENTPPGIFRYHHSEEWELVRVMGGEISKEIMSLHMGGLRAAPDREMVTRIEGTVTMKKLDGSTFTAEIIA